MRVPFINPAAGFTADPTFTILDALLVDVIDTADPAGGLIQISNPLRTYAGSFRSGVWKNTLSTNAISYANQFTNFVMLGTSWSCTWGGVGCPVTNLESTHGTIHWHIGGSMGSVPTAAKDPIFMMHHANIDRILQAWQGSNPLVWFAAGTESSGNFYYPAGAALTTNSPLAPFQVGTGSLIDSNFTRYMHNNFLITNRYSYTHTNITGARRRTRRLQEDEDEINVEKSNRLLAAQVLAELAQLQKPMSFRLQYMPPGTRNSVRLSGPNGLQEDPRYCGGLCTFTDDMRQSERSMGPQTSGNAYMKHSLYTRVAVSICSPPKTDNRAGDKIYTGPKLSTSPVKLSNFSILVTYVIPPKQDTTREAGDDPNGGYAEWDPSGALKLPSKRQLGWWKLLLRILTNKVPVVSDRRSALSGLPTQYVPATTSEGVDLPGAVMGVTDIQ
eukprot:gene12252-12389_t